MVINSKVTIPKFTGFSFQFFLWKLPLKKNPRLITKRICDCVFSEIGVKDIRTWLIDFSSYFFIPVAIITLPSFLLLLFYCSAP